MTLESLAADYAAAFPDALADHAALGIKLQKVIASLDDEAREPARSNKVGRNQPCPCGSGRKFKKCCGAPP